MRKNKCCDLCHKVKHDVRLRLDPYFYDVEKLEVDILLCNKCAEIRATETK